MPCMLQEGAPFSASLDRLEQRISDQIHSVVDVVLTKNLTALEHGRIENFIIAEVWPRSWFRQGRS